jgi:hypothetical protein
MKPIPPRRIKRPRPTPPPVLKPGPVPDPTRDKCVCNLTTLITETEWQQFEKLRLSIPFTPTRSQFVRYLIRESLERRIRRDLPGNGISFERI